VFNHVSEDLYFIPNISLLLFTGTPALTSRGMKQSEFKQVAEFLDEGIKISAQLHKKTSKYQNLE